MESQDFLLPSFEQEMLEMLSPTWESELAQWPIEFQSKEKMAQTDEWLPEFENAMADVLTSSSKSKPKMAKKLKLVMPQKQDIQHMGIGQNGEILDHAGIGLQAEQQIDDAQKRKEVTDAFAAVAAEKRKKAEKLETKAEKIENIVNKRKREDELQSKVAKKAKTAHKESLKKTDDKSVDFKKCKELVVPAHTKCMNIRITW